MDTVKQLFAQYSTSVYIVGSLIILAIILYFITRQRKPIYQVQFMPGAFRERRRGFPVVLRENFKEGETEGTTESEETQDQTKMVVFFAPWCPHCKHFMDGQESLWEQLKKLYSQRGDLKFDQVNGDENKDLAKKMGVDGYPTILKIKKEKIEIFGGERSLDALRAFVDAAF